MPWTLYRYILKDLLRVLVMSSAVLVLVISFAAAIKPLSDGLLDPWSLIRFILYSVPTMLTLVVPFAGTFASTIVFCRLAADNEIVACSAGGISYKAILLPVFLLGLVLSVTLYYMSNWVVPLFFRQATMMIQQDITSLVVSRVKEGRPVEIPGKENYVLYANDAHLSALDGSAPEGELAPYQMISLTGVAMGQFKENSLQKLYTAQQADMFLYRYQGRTWAELRLRNMTVDDPAQGAHLGKRQGQSRAFPLPSLVADDLRFLSWNDLTKRLAEPQRDEDVAKRKVTLAKRMVHQRLMRDVQNQLDASHGSGQVTLLGSDEESYIISAPKVEHGKSDLILLADADSVVRVQRYAQGLLRTTYEAPSGVLTVRREFDYPSEPIIELELDRPTVKDIRPGAPKTPTQKKTKAFDHLRWPSPVLRKLLDFSPFELLKQVNVDYLDTPSVREAAERLNYSIRKMRRRISARVNERAALAVASLLLLVLGAVLSMKLRASLPLVVYFWSFLLASVAVFITRSGENVASDLEYRLSLSLLMVWLGDVGLCAAVGAIYLKLARN